MKDRSFLHGIGNVFGIAQTRRDVPTPAEELEAVRAQLRAAIAAAAERYGEIGIGPEPPPDTSDLEFGQFGGGVTALMIGLGIFCTVIIVVLLVAALVGRCS